MSPHVSTLLGLTLALGHPVARCRFQGKPAQGTLQLRCRPKVRVVEVERAPG